MAPCADFAVAGDLADNEVKGQIRPFFLNFRTGPPYSRPYDTLDETTKASSLVQSSWEDPWRHRAKTQNRTNRSSKPGIAANTAAANAFPDRGGGGYLGRSLPQVFRLVSVIVSPCWLRLPAAASVDRIAAGDGGIVERLREGIATLGISLDRIPFHNLG